MRRYAITILSILLLITSIVSVTYAWFTYVEQKSLAQFDAGVLSISLYKDQQTATTQIAFDDLAFIDYQNDFINQQDHMLNIMASSHRFDIVLDDQSPLTKLQITLDEPSENGLIYIIILEGLNIGSTPITSDYETYINQVISGIQTKEDQLNAISVQNQAVLDQISSYTLSQDDQLTFQVVAWGDYDGLDDPSTYLDITFNMQLNILMINDKGDFNS